MNICAAYRRSDARWSVTGVGELSAGGLLGSRGDDIRLTRQRPERSAVAILYPPLSSN